MCSSDSWSFFSSDFYICDYCCGVKMYRIVLHTFQKTESDSCKWVPKAFVFGHSNAKDAQEWVQKSQNLLDHDTRRPKRLLVCVLFDFVYHSFDKMSKNS